MSFWSFKIDETPTYAFVKNVFNKEECETIIKIGNSLNILQAGVIKKNEKDKKISNKISSSIRKSNISWIFPDENTEWIFRKITDVVTSANDQFFKFNIHGLNEGFQFTHYKAPGGHYDQHIDKFYGGMIRRLSFTILLNNKEDFKGGEFEIYEGKDGRIVKEQEIGNMLIFPSYVMHRVSPVTKGERYSLVGWITGDNIK
jgi:PKHD-type hydroxylase